jgi:hypothetical protein
MKGHRSRSWKEELSLVERHLETNSKRIVRALEGIEAAMERGLAPDSPLVELHCKNFDYYTDRRERLLERKRVARVEIANRSKRFPSVDYKGKRYVRRGSGIYCQYKVKVPGRRDRVAERICKPGPTRDTVAVLIEAKEKHSG